MSPQFKTPYYLIDEHNLRRNLKIIQHIKSTTQAKVLLALKCFSTWSLFETMSEYMDGTTSSSLYEVRLGYEHFPGEVQAYSVAWSEQELEEVQQYADKLIFNSISQLNRHFAQLKPHMNIGLRVNPGISESSFGLCDPNSRYSKLGAQPDAAQSVLSKINGILFHYNSDNANFDSFAQSLAYISETHESLLNQVDWVSLGGGIYFTHESYPIDAYCEALVQFRDRHQVQIYLEPGEASIYNSASLVTSVLDITYNEKKIAVVDSSMVNHLLDRFIHKDQVRLGYPLPGNHEYIIAGKSCLCGEVFGTYSINQQLEIGDHVWFQDIAGYSLVNLNWFNGIQMPSLILKKSDGTYQVLKKFDYSDFKSAMS